MLAGSLGKFHHLWQGAEFHSCSDYSTPLCTALQSNMQAVDQLICIAIGALSTAQKSIEQHPAAAAAHLQASVTVLLQLQLCTTNAGVPTVCGAHSCCVYVSCQKHTTLFATLQVMDVINNATAKMVAAGAVLVPFDSTILDDASAQAWGGGLESYAYEDTDTLARQGQKPESADCQAAAAAALPLGTTSAVSRRPEASSRTRSSPAHLSGYMLNHVRAKAFCGRCAASPGASLWLHKLRSARGCCISGHLEDRVRLRHSSRILCAAASLLQVNYWAPGFVVKHKQPTLTPQFLQHRLTSPKQLFSTACLTLCARLALTGGLKVAQCSARFRYLYRHNYTLSVPEVYYSVNRPDLKELYVAQLSATDTDRLGSNTNWVDYLQTGNTS